MKGNLERFKIVKLHGNKTVDAKIKNNTLIFVGENGSGKTTILRMLFYFLSGNWPSLVQFQFDYICTVIDDVEYKVSHGDLTKSFRGLDKKIFAEVPPPFRKKFSELLAQGDFKRISMELDRISPRYAHEARFMLHQYQFESLEEDQKGKVNIYKDIPKIRKAINAQVLYLPTYRRIERELNSILEGIDTDGFRRRHHQHKFYSPEIDFGDIELVEFGMQDVKDSIKKTSEALKEFVREDLNNLTLGYLGDVVNKEYENINIDIKTHISDSIINDVLSRIPNKILTDTHKSHLYKIISLSRTSKDLSEHEKIIYHYFLKLLEFQRSLQDKEGQITAFCELCSKYLKDKNFFYDGSKFEFSINFNTKERSSNALELSDLSSGEKQIVSLFSHLYLSGQQKYFILIDEPELSLSVPWQKRFLLDIHDGTFCNGLISATHSPFVYANKLREYTHSLGEFIV